MPPLVCVESHGCPGRCGCPGRGPMNQGPAGTPARAREPGCPGHPCWRSVIRDLSRIPEFPCSPSACSGHASGPAPMDTQCGGRCVARAGMSRGCREERQGRTWHTAFVVSSVFTDTSGIKYRPSSQKRTFSCTGEGRRACGRWGELAHVRGARSRVGVAQCA